MTKVSRLWTPAEDDFLRANYKTMSYTEIAGFVKRTPGAVATRACTTLRLLKRQSYAPKTKAAPKTKKRMRPKPFTFDQTPCSERELGWTK